MDVFTLIFLPFRLALVVLNFDFTDAEDFAPILSLVVGLAGVVLIHRSLRSKVSLPLFSLLLLLSVWPLLPNFALFFLAHEFHSINGRWPQVMADDPKGWCGHLSPRFDALFHVTNYLEAFSGAWMVVFVVLFLVVKSRLSTLQLRFCIFLMITALLIAFIDPGELYAWWLD